VFRDVLGWLSDCVAEPVLRAIGPDLSRVWWCPTGPLTTLPLHAAGRVMDRTISSYTATVGALVRAKRAIAADPEPARARRVFAVCVPQPPGQRPLRHVEREMNALRPWLADGAEPLTGDTVTINSTVFELDKYDMVHFACHGAPGTPGGRPAPLLLANNDLTLNRIGWIPRLRAELAFLSACHSAVSSPGRPDDAENLATAFQHLGYKRVIGSLWWVLGARAAEVAEAVYAQLDTSLDSARALRDAVLTQRRRDPDDPVLWASFIHVGV
jgi:CHAT domain-containing protein